MASQYTTISSEEMRDFLKLEKGWKEETQGNELVFSYNLRDFPFIQIKVYSSIRLDTQIGRKVGADAIRVCAVNTKTNAGWIKSSRVYRVLGWKDNLKERVCQVIRDAEKRLQPWRA